MCVFTAADAGVGTAYRGAAAACDVTEVDLMYSRGKNEEYPHTEISVAARKHFFFFAKPIVTRVLQTI